MFLVSDDDFGENVVFMLGSDDYFLSVSPLSPDVVTLGTTSVWCFAEGNVKPEKLTKAPENAGIDPSTMKVKKWHLEPTREDDDPHFPSSSRVSDALTGADRRSYQVREPVENDERLAMKKGDMPPLVPERVANPRIRKEQATTVARKHGLITAELSSRNL